MPAVYNRYSGIKAIPPIGTFESVLSHADREHVDFVINESKKYSTHKLVEITHHQGPWNEAIIKGWSSIITNESILKYYQKYLKGQKNELR